MIISCYICIRFEQNAEMMQLNVIIILVVLSDEISKYLNDAVEFC